jgi:hypothetical protein
VSGEPPGVSLGGFFVPGAYPTMDDQLLSWLRFLADVWALLKPILDEVLLQLGLILGLVQAWKVAFGRPAAPPHALRKVVRKRRTSSRRN